MPGVLSWWRGRGEIEPGRWRDAASGITLVEPSRIIMILHEPTPEVDQKIETIREATNKGWALGDDRFRDAVERSLNRRAQPKWVASVRAHRRSNDHERL